MLNREIRVLGRIRKIEVAFHSGSRVSVAAKYVAKSAGIVVVGTAGIGAVALASAYAHARHYVRRTRIAHMPCSSVPSPLCGCRDGGVYGDAEGVHSSSPHQELRILHFSDFHAFARHCKLRRFIRSLREIKPDLLIFTGDLISEDAAIPKILEALEEFRGIPGFFVFGSNDYFKPKPRNPLAYLVRNSNELPSKLFKSALPTLDNSRLEKPRLNTDYLAAGLRELGFIDLTNTRSCIEVCGIMIDAVGVDDPHIHRDHYPHEGHVDDSVSLNAAVCGIGKRLRIGVTHAPYTRVLDRMAAEGCSLIFAGHTHGGQICLPGHRALVTNCDLPKDLASGLFAWPPTGAAAIKGDSEVSIVPSGDGDKDCASGCRVGDGEALAAAQTWVQVSAGLGTSPFVPLRTWCAPEAIEMRMYC